MERDKLEILEYGILHITFPGLFLLFFILVVVLVYSYLLLLIIKWIVPRPRSGARL